MDDDLGFLQNKLQGGLSTADPDEVSGALGRVFGSNTFNPQSTNTPSLQASTTSQPAQQTVSSNSPVNTLQSASKPLQLQMTNPQQQTDQSQPLKLNFGQQPQQNQQNPQLSTQLVNYNKPDAVATLKPIQSTIVPAVPTKTFMQPTNVATPQSTLARIGAPIENTLKGIGSQALGLGKAVTVAPFKISEGLNPVNPSIKEVKQGVQGLRPVATEVRQIAQSFPQEGVRIVKSVVNPGTNTKPVASKNPITKFLVGSKPVESYQQQYHNAPGGTAGKATTSTLQGIFDAVNLIGIGAAAAKGVGALGSGNAPAVTDLIPETTEPTTMSSNDLDSLNKLDQTAQERLLTQQEQSTRASLQAQKDNITRPTTPQSDEESLDQTAPAPKYEKITTRDTNAERAAQQVLQNGGTKDEAIKAYQVEHPTASPKAAAFQVSRMARESKLPLRPNSRSENPEEGNHDLPTAKPGEYNRANINKTIVDTATDSRLKTVNKALSNLSQDDRDNFEDYLEQTKPIEDADYPEAVQDAIEKGLKLTDTGNALDHSVGGTTPHIENYFPGYTDRSDMALQDSLQTEADLENEYGTDWYKLTKDQQQELIAERLASESKSYPDDENFGGFRNMKRQFATRAERQAAGVKDLYTDPRDAYSRYANGLKFKVGNDAFTKAAQEADQANQMAGDKVAGKINLGGGKDTGNLTQKTYDALKENDVNSGSKNPLIRLNTGIKKVLIGTSSPHAIIIPPRYIGARLMLGADTSLRNLLSDPSLDNINKLDNPDDIAEFGARVDSPIHGDKYTAGVAKQSKNPITNLVYNKFLPAMHASLLRGLKNFLDSKGISYDSDIAQNYGHQINDVMGYSKNGSGAFDQLTFAPSLIKSTTSMYAKAATPTGLIARGGVLGQQIVNESLTFLSKSISNQISQSQGKPQNKSNDNFWSTFIEGQEGKLYTPFRNSKGEQVMLSIPGQYEDKPLQIAGNLSRGNNGQLKVGFNKPSQIASNVVQTAKDVASPVVNAGLSIATGQSYNGTQIRNPYASLPTQAEQTGINVASNMLPINLQGLISSNVQKHLPGALQSAIQVSKSAGSPLLGFGAQTLGLTPEANQTTGQGPAINQYYAGQTKGQDYIAAHSNNTATQNANLSIFNEYNSRAKNNAGQSILLGPKQAAANSALIASNPTVLAGIQIAEKANGKGNYNPTWNLPVTNKPGQPSLQTYMTYEALPKGDPNRTVMEQKDPWLINTFNQEQTYYNQSVYKSTAVPGAGYVAYPNISSDQSNMMTQVTQLASNQNRTPAQETQLENLENSSQLQTAYTLLDNYTNANRKSEGLAPIPYPTQNMTPAQQQLLDQEEALPSGTGQKSALIEANQTEWNNLEQIMADSTQYAIEEYGGVVQQGGTEPNLLKDESTIGQDIATGTNTATGQKEYQLNPALAYSGGASGGSIYTASSGGSGSGSSSSSDEPLVAMPRIKYLKQPKMKKPPHLKGFKAPHIRRTASKPVKVSGAHPVQVAKPTSVVKLKTA